MPIEALNAFTIRGIETNLAVMATALCGMAEAQQRLTAKHSQITETVSLYMDRADSNGKVTSRSAVGPAVLPASR